MRQGKGGPPAVLYFESYKRCGCVSEYVARKRDLPGYCPKHGTDVADVFVERNGTAAVIK